MPFSRNRAAIVIVMLIIFAWIGPAGSAEETTAHVCTALGAFIKEHNSSIGLPGVFQETIGDTILEPLEANPNSPVVLDTGQPVPRALMEKIPKHFFETPRLYHFGIDQSLFALRTVGGTASCESVHLYRIVEGGTIESIAEPRRQGSDKCRHSTYFGSYSDPAYPASTEPVIIYPSDDSTSSTLTIYSRRGGAWQKPCALVVDLNTELTIIQRFCAPGGSCGSLESLALDLARKRDAAGPAAPGRLGEALRVTADEVNERVDLPRFGEEGRAYFYTYERDTPVYKLEGPSGQLAIRISHGSFDTFINKNWIVGVYELSGKSLKPGAGFVIIKRGTTFRDVALK